MKNGRPVSSCTRLHSRAKSTSTRCCLVSFLLILPPWASYHCLGCWQELQRHSEIVDSHQEGNSVVHPKQTTQHLQHKQKSLNIPGGRAGGQKKRRSEMRRVRWSRMKRRKIRKRRERREEKSSEKSEKEEEENRNEEDGWWWQCLFFHLFHQIWSRVTGGSVLSFLLNLENLPHCHIDNSYYWSWTCYWGSGVGWFWLLGGLQPYSTPMLQTRSMKYHWLRGTWDGHGFYWILKAGLNSLELPWGL